MSDQSKDGKLTISGVSFNYVLFIQRLLDGTSPDFHDGGYDPERKVIGLDM